MKYPIGIQTFEKLRREGYAYVDKTRQVYDLVSGGGYYFLSRPRRFGKSLLLTTLKAYFEGKRELFNGLAIDGLESEWRSYPVILLDLNNIERNKTDDLEEVFDELLKPYERKYQVREKAVSARFRFRNIIHAANEQEQKPVVILIDEYDKPMLANMEMGKPVDEVRERLKAFYSVLKSEDAYIRFAMLTGVTRFSKVSVFSDLNNLDDISMASMYADICGITESELTDCFDEAVSELARSKAMSKDDCYGKLRQQYDGYHFARNGAAVYNPFSVLNTLRKREFANYWFATGTPSFLIDVIKRTEFDFTKGLEVPISEAKLADVDSIEYSPVPILFQTGYLTLKDYDPAFHEYTLGYPNSEVREGFASFMLPKFSPAEEESENIAKNLVRAVRNGDAEGIAACLKLLFDQKGNYMLYEAKSKERDFRNIVYMVFSVLGIYTQAEMCTSAGRLDVSIETKDYVYIIEMKTDQNAAAAIRQIKTHGYAKHFEGDDRPLLLMGVNFSTKTNTIDDWAVEAQ